MVEWTETQPAEGVGLRLTAGPGGIRSIAFATPAPGLTARATGGGLLAEAVRQLRAYFQGELRQFDLPLDFAGTPFQIRVWRQLLTIPYGETRSYAQVAAAIGSPLAVRAVGAANGANPIAIVVPCHRVVGASGKLVGYGGGLELKKRLLELERPGSVAPGLPF
jgi:methylated-DNA-[protein]-cysteine S-methyltransferase